PSNTIRTARSRTSGEYLFVVFVMMLHPTHELEPPANPARFNTSVDVHSQDSRDEIGEMARAVSVFKEGLLQKAKMEQENSVRDKKQTEVVQSLRSGLSSLAKGDLSSKITTSFPQEYEQLRQDFNETVETLRSTIEKLISAAQSVNGGSSEISSASTELAQRTEHAAATLQESSAAIQQLNGSVKEVAENAQTAKKLVSSTQDEAEASKGVVDSAVAAMAQIKGSSDKISSIVSVIEDISFQTNLLALNAGVEAARAGEVGRGFAVVASEVRALAQRCTEAAAEISALVVESRESVDQGVELVGNTGDALGSILGHVVQVSDLIGVIASGAHEQATGLDEISLGVGQLDTVAQQNAAMVEEVTAAAHILAQDATSVDEIVRHFSLEEAPEFFRKAS
ncbi:methyl-accepting chemotaxis protein, partial [Yoonia sp. F2084L]|uniref:methyl-accepting chemotaxis protein n=1 Tax=Yoonia sp. F2084L TaxID=2926419 RepID=UPI001FF292B6